ncbi:MAG: DNA polymerase III subunit gamma/tau [Endomicrobium sp.]|jgi:DNA polymerase-3 subunit gamma/tau|nr:DNA polymerase III subunit gamma/tau [Endomicrobium sp.]
MSYTVLANKLRPQTFDEIIGQDYICKILKNSIKTGRIANAYLFSGNKGCGKTTMARIFAKALNCEKGPTINPCGICSICKSITKGTNLDVLEIDGASNNGIDEIRALINNSKFSNTHSRYKIYIIDEAHQITIQAFNALLKIMEEPPDHVIFILATTMQSKIPITILSRCQIYPFSLISSLGLTYVIRRVANKENLKLTVDAINIIISLSNGSIRDAFNILDQILNMKTENFLINGDAIRQMLGIAPKQILFSIINSIATNNIKTILQDLTQLYENGYNILQFAKDLRNYLRTIMIYSINPDLLKLSIEDKNFIITQGHVFSINRHIRISNLLSKAIQEIKNSSDDINIILEMYIIKIAEPYYNINELIAKIDHMIKQNSIKNKFPLAHIKTIWHNIVDEIINKNPLTAQSLKNIAIKITDHNILELSYTSQLDFNTIIEFKDIILSMLKKMTNNLNIKIQIKKNDASLIHKHNIENDNMPQYVLDIAKQFGVEHVDIKEKVKN